jgi:hypothetical protein
MGGHHLGSLLLVLFNALSLTHERKVRSIDLSGLGKRIAKVTDRGPGGGTSK